MSSPFHVGPGSSSPQISPEDFARNLVDSLIESEDPYDLPKPVFKEKDISSIERLIADKEAANHLREFNRVKDLGHVISETIFLCHSKDETDRSIVHVAIERNDLPMLKLAIFFAPNLINACAKGGMSPISLAALNGHTEMIEWLADPSRLGKKEKANINDRTEEGQTPLHKAILFGHRETAAKLVALGADKNLMDMFGLTPADWACFKLHSYDLETKVSIQDDPLQEQKYRLLMQEFAPTRGVLAIKKIIELLGFTRADEK